MTEPVLSADAGLASADYADDTGSDELSTSYLHGEQVGTGGNSRENRQQEEEEAPTDWLALLSGANNQTGELPDDPPAPRPGPSGMMGHRAAPRMRPTVGARLTTGIRRGSLLLVLSALVIGIGAAGTYYISSSSWLAGLLAARNGEAHSSPAQQAPPPVIGQGGSPSQADNSPLQDPSADQQEPSGPTGGGASTGISGGAGQTTAADLRDKGAEQYRAGNYTQAVDLLENSVTINSSDAVAYYQLGLAYMALSGRDHALEDAELAFRTAISLQGEWAAPQTLLAESLLRRGFFKEAVAPAEKSTQLDPEQPEAWMTLGRAYAGAGRQADAARAYSEATRHAPAPPR